MSERLSGVPRMISQFVKGGTPRFGAIEVNRGCNRRCPYCEVPDHYDQDLERTVEETREDIDWLKRQGYAMVSILGGEPLAPFITKEGITFAEHTCRAVEHASANGMVVNVTTNGDYLTQDAVDSLRHAGLDTLSLSLHTLTQQGLNDVIQGAKMAAKVGILPTVHIVLTTENAERIPEFAAQVAENGVLFGVGIIQEKGGGFSARRNDSHIPTSEQLEYVFQTLLRLKQFGFVRNSRRYLRDVPKMNGLVWRCNPETDTFVHLGAERTINVCSDVRTNLRTADIPILRSDERWRSEKGVLVRDCGGCLNNCFFDTENPDIAGEVSTFGVAMLIRSGNARLAERWGRYALNRIKQTA